MRPLHARFSRAALKHNLAVLKKFAPHSQHCAVIKANAYGHRINNFLSILEQEVDLLAVACIEEALEIRRAGSPHPILLLEGVFDASEYLLCEQHNFSVVVSSRNQIEWLLEASLTIPLSVFIKVDTGMHRLGIAPSNVKMVFERLQQSSNVKNITLMTHFACADEKDHHLTQRQIEAMATLDGIDAPQSMANSAILLSNPAAHKDLVRFGIALYGVSPIDKTTGSDFALKPLITLATKIIHTTIIEKGETVGYGAKFIAPETMPIGVIAGGYADGYPREISKDAYVLLGFHKAPIIGRPAMDMMMIDLRNIPEGDWSKEVILFGEGLPVEYVAMWAKTIPYTIFTHLAKRIHFQIFD